MWCCWYTLFLKYPVLGKHIPGTFFLRNTISWWLVTSFYFCSREDPVIWGFLSQEKIDLSVSPPAFPPPPTTIQRISPTLYCYLDFARIWVTSFLGVDSSFLRVASSLVFHTFLYWAVNFQFEVEMLWGSNFPAPWFVFPSQAKW